jgi:hypothetical protein
MKAYCNTPTSGSHQIRGQHHGPRMVTYSSCWRHAWQLAGNRNSRRAHEELSHLLLRCVVDIAGNHMHNSPYREGPLPWPAGSLAS